MKKFVLFDFDGVIADSYATAFEVAIKRCPYLTEAEYRRGFEKNINDWVREYEKMPHGPECRHDLDWFSLYTPAMKANVRPVIEIQPVLEELASEFQLIVLSSTLTNPIEEFLDTFRIAQHFTEILGNDVHHSKIEKMRMVFEKYETDSTHCVFITDTLGDMREAQVHGVGTIGVSWGFHPHETLEKGVPFRIVDAPHELPLAVEEYFAGVMN